MAQTITLRTQGRVVRSDARLSAPALITRFHVLHLSGAARGDPFPKAIQFAELVDGRNAGQFKAGGTGCLLQQRRNLAAADSFLELEPPDPAVRDRAVSRFKTLQCQYPTFLIQ